mmetsp:Transcript_19824/g.30931  ORF Transcript_19824/g.30931 Transcript_19824/m.30931 type:complete len:422 (+) Transcript_19824:83-1348(+)
MIGWAPILSSILLFAVDDAFAYPRLSTSFITPINHNHDRLLITELQYRGGTSSTEDNVPNECLVDIPVERRKLIERRHPLLAKRIFSSEANIRTTEDWFYAYLGITSASERRQFEKKLPDSKNNKSTIQRLGRHRLHEWFKFFLHAKNVGLSHKQLRKMVLSRPQLLSYKISNIQATTAFFREELGLSSEDFISILQSYPSVLMYSIDNRLRPTVDFLQNTVQCTDQRVKRICTSYPNVFSHSLDKTFVPKIRFFKELGLNRSEISQVVAKFAPTLWLSEENLRSKLDFLSKSLGLKNFELRTVVLTYPQILGLSVENNVTPKMHFFLHPEEYDGESIDSLQNDGIHFVNCGLRKSELKDFVLYQPALLAYSLEGRLKPRIARMKDYNISFLYSPRNIMSYTDEKFQAWLSSQTSSWSIVN